ncbi:DUF4381 domain-containing protein [Paraglaciecola sp. L3A3]|uniref:DUF4381 domain-containing protein n=1 Tax=Paraglaciecola sp. L3A3 TaxID=2686358 RepID=UPI00131E1440|nr:DUF4381 domain-containing protein [Paraglaciecola sp. L3A3]
MNPLDNLKDIQNPAEIGNWPPAYGWWLLALVAILVLFIAIKWVLHFKQQRQAKQQALKEIELINIEQPHAATQLNQILKRVALEYFPSCSVQKLHGEQWVNFLIKTLPNKQAGKNSEQITQLQNSLYQKQTIEAKEIAQHKHTVQQWVKLAVPPSKNISQTLEQEHA